MGATLMVTTKEIADYWMSYFLSTGNRTSKVWLLSPKPSRALDRTHDFTAGGFGISVIDQFAGRDPFLINHDFAVKRVGTVCCIPTVVLDSHIVDYLTKYAKNPGKLSGDQYRAVRKFLEFMIERGYDYNPFFYYIESVARNGKAKAKECALDAAETLLRLHTMDERVFKLENRIVTDPAGLEPYAERFGVATIEEMVPLMIEAMTSDIDAEAFNGWMEYSYAVLLKMVLIHLGGKRTVEEKCELLRDFMEGELNVVAAREGAIAPYYFAGQLERFIPVKKGMSSFADARKKLKASAWDLFLLRIPELHLAMGDEEETLLCYICTSERDLRAIGRHFTIEQVVAQSSHSYPATAVSLAISSNDKRLSADKAIRIVERQKQRVDARASDVAATRRPRNLLSWPWLTMTLVTTCVFTPQIRWTLTHLRRCKFRSVRSSSQRAYLSVLNPVASTAKSPSKGSSGRLLSSTKRVRTGVSHSSRR
jgi:hypothetical protein